jgi:hypothetical protein
MRKPLGDLPQVPVVTREAAARALRRLDLAPGVWEDRAEAGYDRDPIAELPGEFLEPALGNIGPDAEDIRVVRDFDFRHLLLFRPA